MSEPGDPRPVDGLAADGLAKDLDADGRWAPWPPPEVVRTTETTMADVEQLARAGAPEGTTVVAEEQTAGRGRHGRQWESRPFAGLWLSLLLRPPAEPMLQIGWLTLAVGVGVSRGIDEATGVDVGLKWPNDLVTDDGKVAGILAERLPDGSVVMGIGINVDQERAELPETGTSLRLLGSTAPRQRVLTRVLGAVAATYRDWRAGEGIADAYLARSRTIGQQVRVNGFNSEVIGRAEGLDDAGRLLVRDDQGVLHALSAGDVIHLRG